MPLLRRPDASPHLRIEPLTWLRYVLTELPQRAGDADIEDLLPFNFAKTATA
ncbi:transposase domain-containing protein [Ensifer sp. NM-2]|uniref:transposase domain-containing protein n=1 Tax=Ensifer sp. NM-2 TaxID=2109730 RepID=UPI000D13C2CA